MIAQVLSRSFLLPWLDAVELELQSRVDKNDDDAGEFAAALADIAQARDTGIVGQPDDSADAGADRRRGWDDESTLDERSFFSRGPVMSLLQSAIEERVEDEHAELMRRDDAEATRRRGFGDDLPPVTDTVLEIDDTDIEPGRRLFGRFQPADFRWVAEIGIAKALSMFRNRHPFNAQPADVVGLADDARLVIVGDWGSGLPRAQRVAEHMRAKITEGVTAGRQVHAIHLGDVYYSGFGREYENRFLPYWPVKPEEADVISSWCVNGNHDMYSGGHGYFNTLLADPRFACQQQSSWFRIENEHWRIVGADTAWDERGIHDSRTERGLADPQASQLQQWAAEDDKPFLLLSHHQLFSSYETPGPYLRHKLEPLLAAERIRAWFWGHEHKCVVYEPHDGVEYGRCIGHGGVPVYTFGGPKQEPAITWAERRELEGTLEPWAVFGFAVADFEGPRIHLSYIDEYGEQIYEETLSSR
jgi:hypothetical protein